MVAVHIVSQGEEDELTRGSAAASAGARRSGARQTAPVVLAVTERGVLERFAWVWHAPMPGAAAAALDGATRTPPAAGAAEGTDAPAASERLPPPLFLVRDDTSFNTVPLVADWATAPSPFAPHPPNHRPLAFSASGNAVAAGGSSDGALRVTVLDTRALIASASAAAAMAAFDVQASAQPLLPELEGGEEAAAVAGADSRRALAMARLRSRSRGESDASMGAEDASAASAAASAAAVAAGVTATATATPGSRKRRESALPRRPRGRSVAIDSLEATAALRDARSTAATATDAAAAVPAISSVLDGAGSAGVLTAAGAVRPRAATYEAGSRPRDVLQSRVQVVWHQLPVTALHMDGSLLAVGSACVMAAAVRGVVRAADAVAHMVLLACAGMGW